MVDLKTLHHARKIQIVLLICGAYAADLFFDLASVGNETKMSFFPFFHGYEDWDGKMTAENYIYGYSLNLWRIMIFRAVYLMTDSDLFLGLVDVETLDLIDFILIYNHTWFTLNGFEFEFNYIKIGLVAYLIRRNFKCI